MEAMYYVLAAYLLFLVCAFCQGCMVVCKKEEKSVSEFKENDLEEEMNSSIPILSNALKESEVEEIDDLKKIKGVGVKLEKLLHSLGVYTFKQIAEWSEKDVQKVDSYLKFPGRIERDGWIEQAKALYEEKLKRQ